MSSKKKYLVIGGWITSKTDGDRHYIHAKRLIELYQIDPKECILVEGLAPSKLQGMSTEGFIVLTPRSDGDYDLGTRIK